VNGKLRPANIDTPLLTAIARAHRWAQSLVTGDASSITEIARREAVSPTYVGQLVPIGFLAPALVEAILNGQQPLLLTADRLIRRAKISMRWSDQLGGLADGS
jgi:hypothetical protein